MKTLRVEIGNEVTFVYEGRIYGFLSDTGEPPTVTTKQFLDDVNDGDWGSREAHSLQEKLMVELWEAQQ